MKIQVQSTGFGPCRNTVQDSIQASLSMTIKPTFDPVSTFTVSIKPKGKTRAERKAMRESNFRSHPVLSGAVPIVTYTPPGCYGKS